MSSNEMSWSGVFQNIVSNVEDIVRTEVRLAKTEIKEEAQQAAKASVSLAVGAGLLFYAAGFLFLCMVYALRIAVDPWLAALIVSVLLGLVAVTLISAGWKKMKTVQAKPVTTIESVKETVQWARKQSS